MKSLQIILLVLVCAVATCLAQKSKPCSPNLLSARVHGFSLGMTKAVVSGSLDGIVPRAQSDGTDVAILTRFDDRTKFYGVRQMDFHFFRNVLYRVAVHYDDILEADSLMTFADGFAKSWKIKEKWSDGNMTSRIECRQRTALATSDGGGKKFSLTLTDNLAVERINNAKK
jgi:hypothetical protein